MSLNLSSTMKRALIRQEVSFQDRSFHHGKESNAEVLFRDFVGEQLL